MHNPTHPYSVASGGIRAFDPASTLASSADLRGRDRGLKGWLRWRLLGTCWLPLLLSAWVGQAATVSWVGGSGDWNVVTNWSTGILPGADDDVVIDSGPNITVTHSSDAHEVKSIRSQPAFVLSGGALTVSSTVLVSNSFMLSGGSLLHATVITTNGASLVVNSGTLDGVTIIGTLDVGNTVNGASLTVTNGLVLNGTALVGNPTNNWYGRIDVSGSQSLSGNGTVVFGNQTSNSGWPNYYKLYYNALRLADADTTLTLGAGITVRGQNGEIGYS